MGFLTILTFWTSTAYSELFETNETIAMVKAMVSKGMFIPIPAMMIAGGSGMSLGRKRVDAKVVAKKKRMPFCFQSGMINTSYRDLGNEVWYSVLTALSGRWELTSRRISRI